MKAGRAAALACVMALGLVACASAPKNPASASTADAGVPASRASGAKVSPYAAAQEDPSKRGNYTAGGLYAPGVADAAPDVAIDVSLIPEPEVVAEPRSRYGNRSTYSVLGKKYHVLDDAEGYVEQGLASYYGTKFHGRKTSNMEVYDMYAFTAAHKTLPLPSYARVTNLDNGTSVVVRVNDRGPFHKGRIIDLSYAAAIKLGITRAGTGRVEVRALVPGEDETRYAARPEDKPANKPVDKPINQPAPRSASVASVGRKPSGMDALVATLPVSAAGAVRLPDGVHIATGKPSRLGATAATAGQGSRFDTNSNGRAMSAGEFDAWMRARRASAATAQPTPESSVTPRTHDEVTLQVASFAARGNADRALAMLHDAGIDAAQLDDAVSGGQRVWRLRVGPVDAVSVPSVASRIAGLGFGTPQRVRD